MTETRTANYALVQSDTAVTPKGKVTASTASATVAAANPFRVALVVTNNGAKDVWLALGSTAVAEEGILLNSEGGAHIIDYYLGVVTVITKEAESVVSFTEV